MMSEQARADQLDQALDQLFAGESPADPTLIPDVAALLASDLVRPSAESRARLDRQIDQWFGPTAPPLRPTRPLRRVWPAIGLAVAAAIILGIGLLVFNPARRPNQPTVTPSLAASLTSTIQSAPILPPLDTTVTASPSAAPTTSASATSSVTATMTNSPSPTPLTSPTAILYAAIVIEGPVETINGSTIVIYGQSIKLHNGDSTLLKLKIGTWVKVSGHYVMAEDQITIVIEAVTVVIIDTPPLIVAPPANTNNGNSNGDQGDDDKGKKHKDD